MDYGETSAVADPGAWRGGVIGGSIAMGALFQSTPGPTNSVQVAETTHNDAAKSSSVPQGVAPLGSQPANTTSKTAPVAPDSKSATAPSANTNATAPAKESNKAATDTNTKANNAVAPASQVAQTAVPIIHNHAARRRPRPPDNPLQPQWR